MLLFSSALSDH